MPASGLSGGKFAGLFTLLPQMEQACCEVGEE